MEEVFFRKRHRGQCRIVPFGDISRFAIGCLDGNEDACYHRLLREFLTVLATEGGAWAFAGMEEIRSELLRLVRARGVDKTICPSEVARAVAGAQWRELMNSVREVGVQLAREGVIVVTQRGSVVDPMKARGAIRYRLCMEGTENDYKS